MPILRRNLTVHFQRSVKVTSTDIFPQSVEVSVIPLQDASNAQTVATYVGGIQSVVMPLVDDDNPVTFSLVPSDFPGLTNPINYRIMWRVGGITGRTETYDFSMPDADVEFDELHSLNNIIDGEAYLQQSDLGVAGRVAKLNDDGAVVDAFGVPVAIPSDVEAVQQSIDDAVATLEEADENARINMMTHVATEIGVLSTALTDSINQTSSSFSYLLNAERDARISSDADTNASLAALSSTTTQNTDALFDSVSGINDSLALKADLVDGLVPVGQIPPEAITNWIPLDTSEDRLALVYPDDVQLGDVVLTPSGLYGLIAEDPSDPLSWYTLNQVLSVNGLTGEVNLTAEDVGAIDSDAIIPQSQVADLVTTLAGLALTSSVDSLQSQITDIVNDPDIVRLNGESQIESSYLDEGVAYVNVLDQIVKKDGTILSDPSSAGVLSINGRSGVLTLGAADFGAIATGSSLPQSQITGLVTALAAKADLSSGTVLLTQIPSLPQSRITGLTTSLLAKADLINGVVPTGQIPSLSMSKITGLSDIINTNGLSTLSNVVARITNLENRPVGSGGESLSYIPAVAWNGGVGDTLDMSTVVLSSPFGIYQSGPNTGQYYYNSEGVSSSDAAFPVITPNGHLKLYKWNEDNPADPSYALASDLTAVSNSLSALGQTVTTKASQADLTTQTSRINSLTTTKADLDAVTGTLATNQIPFLAKDNPKVVSSLAAMKAFTTSQVHIGDTCIITTGDDRGTYTLVGSNPAQTGLSGWYLHPVPTVSAGAGTGTVTSVSGPSQTRIYPDGNGNIALTAGDLGAATTTSVSDLTTTVNTKQSSDQVQTAITSAIGSSQLVRGRVDYAVRAFSVGATQYCANGLTITAGAPSGSPAIDKDASGNLIYAPNNALVLLTNQSDSRYNGIWKVNTSSQSTWSRPTDYAAGSRVYPDTIVIVNSSFAGVGTANYTVWQNTYTSVAVVDSVAGGVNSLTQWRNLGTMAPVTITGSNGITVSGTYPNITLGSGSSATFVKQYYTTIIPTSDVSTRTVTHGLNNLCPSVTVVEDTSGNFILVGWKTTSANAIVFDFSPSVMTVGSTYRVTVQG